MWEANKNGASLLKSALCFPIGLTMTAEHVRDNGSKYEVDDIAYWEENVTLGVDMEPDYLFEDSDGGKQLINLGVQNVCFFGYTGVPVLPLLAVHSTIHPLLQHLLRKIVGSIFQQ